LPRAQSRSIIGRSGRWQLDTFLAVVFIVGCYAAGAVPFGLIVVKKLKGVDIRTIGSGNIGATNVARAAGRKVAILVFALDFAKGFVPTLLVYLIVEWTDMRLGVAVIAGLATVLGHMFPVYLKFKGGKGVATAAGMLTALAPLALAISILVWVLVVGVSKYVSLGSLSAAVALPLSFILSNLETAFNKYISITELCTILCALVVFSHKENIKRLLAGTENRVGRRVLAEDIEQVQDDAIAPVKENDEPARPEPGGES
jgi:glycerol-3-phosphate acyltransferase PlsY